MKCAWCSDIPFPEALVTEQTDAPLRERLTGVDGIADPASLTFCNKDCQQQFHSNLRRLNWDEHDAMCACVRCLG